MSAPLRAPAPSAATPVAPRLGFLGVGRMGCRRLESLAKTDSALPTALYDPSAEALARARDVAPQAECLGSPEALLDADIERIVDVAETLDTMLGNPSFRLRAL